MTHDPYWKEVEKFELAIGKAVATWGLVESSLLYLFARTISDSSIALTLWESVNSFDAKLKAIQSLLRDGVHADTQKGDLVLLMNHTRKLYSQRNKIAHGTIVPENGPSGSDIPMLAPFYSGKDGLRLSSSEILILVDQFNELQGSLRWLRLTINAEASAQLKPPQSSGPPTPDLVIHLRQEAAQIRKEQSKRQRLLAHATRLANENRLPDWD